ncbi:MAG TPA: hypothetical protein PKA64_08745 [Myxococcota bacterium]|nr:hypothetical protein [Myxococcota bacterium]
MGQHRPVWDFVVTYQGADYPLDLNALTKREEIDVAKKTGLDRAGFVEGFISDDPEATIAGVWLALRRALGDDAPAYTAVDLPSFGDWIRFADEAAVEEWVAEQVADAADPTADPPAGLTAGG